MFLIITESILRFSKSINSVIFQDNPNSNIIHNIGIYKIAVARVTVSRSIIVSLYTEFFPLEQLLTLRNFSKKSVSQSTRNALKRIEMQKKLPLMSGFSLCRRMFNIFKKKCVSIDSNCSETHRNAKKILFPL